MEARRDSRKQTSAFADYVLVMQFGRRRISGFLWNISDSGLGAIFPLQNEGSDFVRTEDDITGTVLNQKLNLKMEYSGKVRWKKPLDFNGTSFISVGIQFQNADLPDALYALSKSLET